MPDENEPKVVAFTVRVAPELRHRIRIAAAHSDVTMNDWISRALEQAVERAADPLASVYGAK